jgi:hypothetical protein
MDEVQANTKRWCDELDKYQPVTDTNKPFDILHMYPSSEMAFPDGYYDAMRYTAIAYDRKSMTCMNLGEGHDALSFFDNIDVASISIYVDGSTVIRFAHPVKAIIGQAIAISEVENNFLFALSRFLRRLAK